MTRILLPVLLTLGFLASPGGPLAAQTAPRRPLAYKDYARWRSLREPELSPNGEWVAYGLAPAEGDGELIVRRTRGTGEYRHPRGAGASFTHDSRHVVFTVNPPAPPPGAAPAASPLPTAGSSQRPAGLPASRPGATPPTPPAARGVLVVQDLGTGAETRFERLRSWSQGARGGRLLAVLTERPAPHPAPTTPAPGAAPAAAAPPAPPAARGAGTELVVGPAGGAPVHRVEDVTTFTWSRDGAWLAWVVDAPGGDRDGVFVRRSGDGRVWSLLTGDAAYQRLTLADKDGRLAFFTDLGTHGTPNPVWRLFHWEPDQPAATDALAAARGAFPPGWSVSPNSAPRFSADGSRLFFGTAPARPARPAGAPPAYNVDLWHWKDPLLPTMQRARAPLETARTYPAVAHLRDRRYTQLATADVPEVTLSRDGDAALASSDVPYRPDMSWDGFYQDAYFLDLADGSRRQFLKRSGTPATLSPGGRYALNFREDEGEWYAHRLSDGAALKLTGPIRPNLAWDVWDRPTLPPPYGVAGWTEGDRSVVVYDRYDLWEVFPEGGAPRLLTGGLGRKQRTALRFQRLDPEERALPASMLLSATHEDTGATGYYRLDRTAGAPPQRLVLEDCQFGGLQKAREADVLLFGRGRFDTYPDLWVSDMAFGDRRRLSDANPQQAEYRWGRNELMDYRSADGKRLKALVSKPDDFEPGRRYPVLVSIYEERTQALHQYGTPNAGTSPNVIRYVSNGYVVLQPDILFDRGRPGESSLNCVVPAVRKLIDLGIADPQRIGIAGHSWGGYQVSYLVTRTNLFRAAEAGAPVANMLSAYGGIRYQTGMVRQFQYETGQSRIGGTPWNRRQAYLDNSPVLALDRVRTPLLILHNDNDGAVPWTQGIELFTGLRRLGKEAYLFNYNGEGHGIANRENARHYTVHMDEFFDHLLLGAPRPEWMERGVPFAQRGERDVRPLFK
jgi:dienelactone hydrolase